MAHNIESQLCFLGRDPVYESEKPYSLRFDPLDDIPRHNLKINFQRVPVADARGLEATVEQNGFTLTTIPTKMRYSDFENPKAIESTYALEIQNYLKNMFRAKHARIVDYNVRRRHPTFPISTGTTYEHQQPAVFVHLDFSHAEAENMLRTIYGLEAAKQIMQHQWQVINVWRPLKGPLFDWPIAVCDAKTFDVMRDAQDADAVHSQWTYENVLIHHHPLQKWYYYSALLESETMVFKCTDSDRSACGPSPHAAFELPPSEPGGAILLRESVESRVFLFWAPMENLPPEIGSVYGRRDD